MGFKILLNIIYDIAVVIHPAQGMPGGDRGLPQFFCFEEFLMHSLSPAQHIPPEPGTRHPGSEWGFQCSVKDFLLSHLRAYNYSLLQASVMQYPLESAFSHLRLITLNLCLSIFVSPTLLTQVFSGDVLVAITR